MFLIWTLLTFSKLLCSNKVMSIILSIEVIMSSIMMMWLINEMYYDQCYYYIMFFCMTVCEGVIGLSILVSVMMSNGKFHSGLYISKL